MELFDDVSNVDFSSDYFDLPFAGDIEASFDKIENLLKNERLENLKLAVLKNAAEVIELLTGFGNAYEELVLDTAQLYILAKLTKLNLDKAATYFDKYAIEGAKILANNTLLEEEYIKSVFENREYRYLAKIKIADYIFEIKENGKQRCKQSGKLDEIKKIINLYGEKSQKDLMKYLKEIIG